MNLKVVTPKVLLMMSSNAPSRDAKLTISAGYRGFDAFWGPGYSPCSDGAGCAYCGKLITGHGDTEEAAIADYWQQWEEN